MSENAVHRTGAIQISTTADSEDAARTLADHLVHERLAACVQVLGPIASTYQWQHRVETSREWLCLIKTRVERFSDVENAIREHHSYDLPEIVACPIVQGSDAYLEWILASVPAGATQSDAQPAD